MEFIEPIQASDSLVMVHRDAAGNIKPVFQENKMFTFLINHGLLSPTAWKIPYLLGKWQDHKEVTLT